MRAQTILGMNKLMQTMFEQDYLHKRCRLVPHVAEQVKTWVGGTREYTIENSSFTLANVCVRVQDTEEPARTFWVNLDEVIICEPRSSD